MGQVTEKPVAIYGKRGSLHGIEDVNERIDQSGLEAVHEYTEASVSLLVDALPDPLESQEKRRIHSDVMSGAFMRTMDDFVEDATEAGSHTREEYQSYADTVLTRYIEAWDENAGEEQLIKQPLEMLPDYGGIREMAAADPMKFAEFARGYDASSGIVNQDQLAGYMLARRDAKAEDDIHDAQFSLFQDIVNGQEYSKDILEERAHAAGFTASERITSAALELQSQDTTCRSLGYHAVVAAMHPEKGAIYHLVEHEDGSTDFIDNRKNIVASLQQDSNEGSNSLNDTPKQDDRLPQDPNGMELHHDNIKTEHVEVVEGSGGREETHVSTEKQERMQRGMDFLKAVKEQTRLHSSTTILRSALDPGLQKPADWSPEAMAKGAEALRTESSDDIDFRRNQLISWVTSEVREIGKKMFGNRIAQEGGEHTKAYDVRSAGYKRGETHGTSTEVVADMLLDYITGDLEMSDDDMQQLRDARDERIASHGSAEGLPDGQHRSALVTIIDHINGRLPEESKTSENEYSSVSNEFSSFFEPVQNGIYTMKNKVDFGEVPQLSYCDDVYELNSKLATARQSLEEMQWSSQSVIEQMEDQRAPLRIALQERIEQIEAAIEAQRQNEQDEHSEVLYKLDQAQRGLREATFHLKKYETDVVYSDVSFVKNTAPIMLEKLDIIQNDINSRAMVAEEYDNDVRMLTMRLEEAGNTTQSMMAYISEQLGEVDMAMSWLNEHNAGAL